MGKHFTKFFILQSLLAAFFLSGCVSDTVGTGPLTLSSGVLKHYEKFKNAPKSGLFAVSIDGNKSTYSYCPEAICRSTDRMVAMRGCNKRSFVECKIFADKWGIVWKHESGRPITIAEASGGYQTALKDISNESNEFICDHALHNLRIEWTKVNAWAHYVEEAKKRNLTPQECREYRTW